MTELPDTVEVGMRWCERITAPAPPTPALVLGGSATALGVIRRLGHKGIPQFAAGTFRSFVAYSRWHNPLPSHRWDVPSPSSLPQLLAELPFERMVLFPC